MDETDEKDAALVRRCLAGDSSAFDRLLDRYEKPIFNAVFRILHDYEEARDVTQTVFVKVYQNLESFDPRYRFFSWLYRSAVNESLNLAKKRRPQIEIPESFPSAVRRADEDGYQGELRAQMAHALMELSPEHRAVLVLKHVSDCSYRELAEIFSIPEKTVKSRLFEARRHLRAILVRDNVMSSGS